MSPTRRFGNSVKWPAFRPRVGGDSAARRLSVAPAASVAGGAGPGWRVVVADRSEARIYAADGAIARLTLRATLRNPSARKPERELVSDRAGRKFNRGAGIRQAVASHSTARRASGERFAKAVATLAGRRLASGERFALIAAPRFLALIEAALPLAARARLTRTLARDAVHEPQAQLRARLQRSLLGAA